MISPTQQHESDSCAARQRGLTLIEMVVTVAVMSVIMLGVGSAMIIAGRALPDADSPAATSIAAAQAAEQIATELQYAITINDSNATAIEFTVADRDSNDVPETIRYEWSSTAGDPLTRVYNGGPVVSIFGGVQQFDLTYDTETTSEEIPQGNESAETLLRQYHPTQDLVAYPIKDVEWYAQYFTPSLPDDAVSWKVTRVEFQAAQGGPALGQSRVQIQLATAGEAPSGVVLEEKTLLESPLTDIMTVQEFSFTAVAGLSPDQGLCLVIKWVTDSEACKICGTNKDAYPSNSKLLKSTNHGASWSVRTGESLRFTIHGTVTTSGEPQIESSYYLDRVEMRLQAGDDAQSTVQTGVRLLNRPEVVQ